MKTIQDFKDCIGMSQRADDVITPRLARTFLATLDNQDLNVWPGVALPAGIHWCLAPAIAPNSRLRADGHPLESGIIPALALRQRMFAASSLELVRPLRVGDVVERRSTVADLKEKAGRTGPLVFLTLTHVFTVGDQVAIREEQQIVFKDPPKAEAASASAPVAALDLNWQETFAFDPVVLFRYSAVSFNCHRIHYDHAYAVDEERQQGLLLHSPLLATLLLRLATRTRGSTPSAFSFRSTGPLTGPGIVKMHAAKTEEGLELSASGTNNQICMTATASWDEVSP